MGVFYNKKRVFILFVTIFLVLSLIFLFIVIVVEKDNKDDENYYLISVDYNKVIGTVNIDYGLNEAADWMDFVNRKETHLFHKDVGSKFIRVWIDDPSYRMNSTIPYERGVYNFDKLDSFINAVLDSDAVPFVVFAYAPEELSKGNGKENANLPIDNLYFADYCARIVEHYKEMCENDKLAKKCNIDEWYWEVWNEPYWNYWWFNATYIKMYNEVYKEIKKVVPGAKIGGYDTRFLTDEDKLRTKWFLENAVGIDFISVHIYSNYPISGPKDEFYITSLENSYMKELYEQEMINNNKLLFYQEIKLLQDYTKKYYKNNDVEIIISELGPNWNWKYEKYLDEPFVAAWYASALNWMIRTDAVDKEFYYSGTADEEEGTFAMWSLINKKDSIILYPVYYMKKEFVKYNVKDSLVYEAESKEKNIEVLAVSNEKGNYLTIINKRNQFMRSIRINVKNLEYTQIIDMKYNRDVHELKVDLEPYEVRFIQLV